MFFKKTSLNFLMLCNIAHIQGSTATAPEINQEQIALCMQNLNKVLMPDYKKVYKKFYDDINQLRRNYSINKTQGDITLAQFTKEFVKVIETQMDSLIEQMWSLTPEANSVPAEIKAQFSAEFKKIMLEMFPVIAMQGLKDQLQMESEVYQELLHEKKIKNQ